MKCLIGGSGWNGEIVGYQRQRCCSRGNIPFQLIPSISIAVPLGIQQTNKEKTSGAIKQTIHESIKKE